jgi:hypothetical protein
MSMKLEPADRDLAVPDVSAIREVPLDDHWPPLRHEPAVRRELGGTGPAGALTLAAGPEFPRQFAIQLAEALAGARPVRQLTPWLSKRGSCHLRRLLPLFSAGQPPRVIRVLTTRPAPDVAEMTMIVATGQRARALAIRLELGTRSADGAGRWQCTDIEAA